MSTINAVEIAHRLELLADDQRQIADMMQHGEDGLSIYAAELRNEANVAIDWASALRRQSKS